MHTDAHASSRFLGSARLLAICTFVSRISGLARDITMNHVYGQGWVQDAFNFGFLIPNLFRRLFGEGALSAVFIPVFTDVLDQRGRSPAWVLLGRVTALMSVVLVVLLILIEIAALGLGYFADGGAMQRLQGGLTAVMAPFMVGVCLVALFASILNCLHHFAAPALLPIVLNVMNIIGALWIGPLFGDALERQAYGVGLAVVASSILQFAIILPVLRSHGVHFRLGGALWRRFPAGEAVGNESPTDEAGQQASDSLWHRLPTGVWHRLSAGARQWYDDDLRRIVRTFIPVLLGQGVLLFNVFFDAWICTQLTRGPDQGPTFQLLGYTIAYPLETGALSAITNAQRLYQFPLGVLAISLATAAFPTFSLFASRGNMDGLKSAIAQSLRLAIFVGLPSGFALVILGRPIIALLFEHGRFGPEDTLRAAGVLTWYGLGMAAYCCQHILLRGFYSLKDTLTPMKVSCWLVAINATLNVGLLWTLGEEAFGLSTAITSWMHVGISIRLLRRRLGGMMGARAIVLSALRTGVCTAAACAVAWWLYRQTSSLDLASLGRTLRAMVDVFGPMLGAAAVFTAASRLLGMAEIKWLLTRQVRAADNAN